MMNLLRKVYLFYYDGFRQMRIGKKLWALILLKLFILFVIVKWLFFPNLLETKFSNDAQRGSYILNQLTDSKE